MFLAIQHTLADVRPLLSYDTRRTPRPTFALGFAADEFVRSLGPVRLRPRGAPPDWPAEDLFCDATRAFRFRERALEYSKRPHGERSRFRVAYRRYLSNGEAVARIETGLVRSTQRGARPLAASGVASIVEAALRLPVRVPPDPAERPLMHAGKPLAKRLLMATSRRGGAPGFGLESWWMSSAPLMVLVEYKPGEIDALPRGATSVTAGLPAAATLHHLRLGPEFNSTRVWLLEVGSGLNDSALRDLRLHLMRLNAEREVIRTVLGLIITDKLWLDPGVVDFDALIDYLDESAGFLARKSVYGHDQSALLQAAYGAEDLVTELDRRALGRRVERMRRRVDAQAADRIERAAERASLAGTFPLE